MSDPTPRADGLREAARRVVDLEAERPAWDNEQADDDPMWVARWDAALADLRAALADSGPTLDQERLAEAIFRCGIGWREGMTALPWAVEHQQEFARWLNDPQIAAEYLRLASPDPTGTPTEPRSPSSQTPK